jgi:hypothetical protein
MTSPDSVANLTAAFQTLPNPGLPLPADISPRKITHITISDCRNFPTNLAVLEKELLGGRKPEDFQGSIDLTKPGAAQNFHAAYFSGTPFDANMDFLIRSIGRSWEPGKVVARGGKYVPISDALNVREWPLRQEANKASWERFLAKMSQQLGVPVESLRRLVTRRMYFGYSMIYELGP